MKDNRDVARDYFKKHNLTYEKITVDSLYKLRELCQIEIENHIEFKMTMCDAIHVCPTKSHKIKFAFLRVSGSYFHEREAISFNEDGFIGFCGWASTINSIPFTIAFEKWVDWIKRG